MLPAPVIDLYRTADGECSEGFFAPDLRFLKLEDALQWLRAYESAVSVNALPVWMRRAFPIFGDAIGNSLVVSLNVQDECMNLPVFYVDAEQQWLRCVSGDIIHLFKRLLQMRDANKRVSLPVCTGDFRSLTSCEREIATLHESEKFVAAEAIGELTIAFSDPDGDVKFRLTAGRRF